MLTFFFYIINTCRHNHLHRGLRTTQFLRLRLLLIQRPKNVTEYYSNRASTVYSKSDREVLGNLNHNYIRTTFCDNIIIVITLYSVHY